MKAAPPKVLLIDDGERYVELAHALLRDYRYATRCELDGPCWECPQRPGCTLTHAHDWGEAEAALARHRDLDVVLLDMNFDVAPERLVPLGEASGDSPGAPPEDAATLRRRKALQGLAILSRIRSARPRLPVVLMTSQAELRLRGAGELPDEYVTLAGADGFDARAIGLLIERVLARREVDAGGAGYVFGADPTMQRLRRDALALARTSLPLLIVGEPGTGKSALAEKVVHPATGRGGPFVSVDASAIPESLVAAELFGSARGAFSGAVDRPGRFEAAEGGTLLLDEIGSLSPDVQRMLLLVLQERRVTRLGEHRARPIDVKVLAATNEDLEAAVRAGRFRADLYARLNPAARLSLPPLRERRSEIPALLRGVVRETFAAGPDAELLAAYAREAGLRGGGIAQARLPGDPGEPRSPGRITFAFGEGGMRTLRAHRYPGNVRELRLLVANLCLLALNDALEAARHDRAGAGEAETIPIPERLVDDLVARSWVSARGGAGAESARRARGDAGRAPRKMSRASSKSGSTASSTSAATATSRRWRPTFSSVIPGKTHGGCGSASISWGCARAI